MIITDLKLLELMQKPLNGEAITTGAKLQSEHKIHITGVGYQSLVRKIEGFESSNDFNVRMQISKPATIQITSIILDNLNRWTTSQGTVKRVDFKDTEKNREFEEVLEGVWRGHSFDNFMNTFYKDALYTEFNGFVLVTKPKVLEGNYIDKEGVVSYHEKDKSLDPYLIFISISDIYDYYLTGDKVEYMIINLGNDTFRLIDDARDMVFLYKGGKSSMISTLPNELGYVPSRKISGIDKGLLNCQVKTSPIDHVIPALDRYFSCDADLRMQFIKHNYPKLAIVVKECTHCHGIGKHEAMNSDGTFDMETMVKCNTCDGTGKEIPISRDGVIGLPEALQQGDSAYPGAPATYISPDVESLRLGIEDLLTQRENIIYSATGDKNLIAESLNTATENTINSRSLEDRIADITQMIEQFEVFIKQCIKDLHNDFSAIADYSITVKYGKRIGNKGESDLMREIKEAKDGSLPLSYIQGLHKDLIYTKYKNNTDELERYLILSDVEPLAAFSIQEIKSLETYIKEDDIKIKMNFDSLIDDFEQANGMIQYFQVDKPYKERVSLIKKQLYEILQKQFGGDSGNRGSDMADPTKE